MDSLPSEMLLEISSHLNLRDTVSLVQVCSHTYQNIFEQRLEDWRSILRMDPKLLKICVEDTWKDESVIVNPWSRYDNSFFDFAEDAMTKLISSYGSPSLLKSERTIIHYVIKYNQNYNSIEDASNPCLDVLKNIFLNQRCGYLCEQLGLLSNVFNLIYKHKLYKLFKNMCRHLRFEQLKDKLVQNTDFAKIYIDAVPANILSRVLDTACESNNLEIIEYIVSKGFKCKKSILYRDGAYLTNISRDSQIRHENILRQTLNRIMLVNPTTLQDSFLNGHCSLQDYTRFYKLSQKPVFMKLFDSLYEKYPTLRELIHIKMEILSCYDKPRCKYGKDCRCLEHKDCIPE